MADHLHTWELRNPDGGMLGLEFARGRMAAHTDVLSHALPERVDIEVRDMSGGVVARATGLEGGASTPMARLSIRGNAVTRENVWPDATDLGKPVILPGGEIGILRSWWNADDGSQWTWTIELHNEAG
ncbi:MAG: hypothetical protein QOI60_355 [Actinomycetota bacterium]|nr:hypothetical protein [Actinomycetota bacterium]